jgi:cold shock CspA family protein
MLKGAGEERRRDALKPGSEEHRGLVVRRFMDQGYGFLRSADEEEIYFRRNGVLHDDIPRLTVGTEVRYELEQMFSIGLD